MRIVYTRQALEDLESIFTYIAEHANRDVAKAVVARVVLSIERLSLFPRSGRRGSVGDAFELVVPKLPYIVAYQLTENEVLVRAVFHGAQDR